MWIWLNMYPNLGHRFENSTWSAPHQAYVDAAETMLVDDVAANKAIGFHGASHLGSHLENMQKISVLTHCNTGRWIVHLLGSCWLRIMFNGLFLKW